MIPYVLITTPSFQSSQKMFGVMKGDAREIEKNGGIVVSKKEVNKYGVADLSINFLAGSLSSEVRAKNALTLSSLGWKSIDRYNDGYCKNGMIYSSYFSDEMYDGMKMVVMNFRYTSQTISVCKTGISRSNKGLAN